MQTYEIAAMEDLFDDGRFVSYDAVTLNILAPKEMADRTIRVYFQDGSLADDSPMRKSGQRLRFDFDKNLPRERQLFGGVLGNIQWIDATGATDAEIDGSMRPINVDVLASLERELNRLEESAKSETRPMYPPPSTQIAYYLLAGLAERGVSLTGLSESEKRLFDVGRQGGRRNKLMSVFTDVRVALIDNWIQDKSGTYVLRTAVLYVFRKGKWAKIGSPGVITDSDPPGP
ncbi:MAG: hypothetical protein O3C40_11375 [Planctomycetota bacterium]|nr:hypothetical protein [Planctomycetota bacterium]